MGRLEENISALQRATNDVDPQSDSSSNSKSNSISANLDRPLSDDSMLVLKRMNLEGSEEWDRADEGKRIALEWNPVDCD